MDTKLAATGGKRYGRKAQALALCPWGPTKFWQYQQSGDMVKPECYLSPTMPVYDLDKVAECVARIVAAAKDQAPADAAAPARAQRAARRSGRARSTILAPA